MWRIHNPQLVAGGLIAVARKIIAKDTGTQAYRPASDSPVARLFPDHLALWLLWSLAYCCGCLNGSDGVVYKYGPATLRAVVTQAGNRSLAFNEKHVCFSSAAQLLLLREAFSFPVSVALSPVVLSYWLASVCTRKTCRQLWFGSFFDTHTHLALFTFL